MLSVYCLFEKTYSIYHNMVCCNLFIFLNLYNFLNSLSLIVFLKIIKYKIDINIVFFYFSRGFFRVFKNIIIYNSSLYIVRTWRILTCKYTYNSYYCSLLLFFVILNFMNIKLWSHYPFVSFVEIHLQMFGIILKYYQW